MDIILEGAISVKAALEGKNRQINRIFAEKAKSDDRNFRYIFRLEEAAGIPVDMLSRDELNAMTESKKHGGLLASAGARKYAEPGQLVKVKNPFIVLLEGVEDPYNFGDAIRSLFAAGATGLIVPERNWLDTAAVVIRASAGASELIPTVVASDIGKTVDFYRDQGIRVYCAERRDAESMYDTDFSVPCIVAVGGEMRGLSRAVLDRADGNFYIPYGSGFRNALSAASACAVCGFEVMRQRRNF